MLYSKYVIEVIVETNIISEVGMNSYNNGTNQLNLSLTPLYREGNIIKFLSNGYLSDIPQIFNTKEEALNNLNTYYYNLINNGEMVNAIKISEIYNDVIPPIEVLRTLKMKKLLKKL